MQDAQPVLSAQQGEAKITCICVLLSYRAMDRLLNEENASLQEAMRLAHKYQLRPLLLDAEAVLVDRAASKWPPWKSQLDMLQWTMFATSLRWGELVPYIECAFMNSAMLVYPSGFCQCDASNHLKRIMELAMLDGFEDITAVPWDMLSLKHTQKP